MPMHHEIEVKLVNGAHAVPAIPSDPPGMTVKDTVHYSSAAGNVTILFLDGSPFADANGDDITVITSAAPPLPLSKQSATGFNCRCFITLPNGTTVGWAPNKTPESGGNHIVK